MSSPSLMNKSTDNLSSEKFPTRFIRAGAGAGKTTMLIKTFFEFVQNYRACTNKFPKIIITTFTRKATQEIKERLLVQALAFNDAELFQFVNKKSYVHISTIHGVLSLLLNRNHDLLGLSSDIKISDTKALYKIYYHELKVIFKKNLEYFELLDHYSFKDLVKLSIKFHEASQESEMNYINRSALIQIRDEKINTILKDLTDILSVRDSVINHKQWEPYLEFIRTVFNALKIQPFNIEAVKSAYANKPNRKPAFSESKPLFNSEINELVDQYFGSKAQFFDQFDSDQFIQTHESVLLLYHQMSTDFHLRMCEHKLKSGRISISDLESLSLKLIQNFPEQVKVFTEQYSYFMIDEYQDTSPLQVTILNALVGLTPHFIVGDPQQSIYLFRGARSEVFLNKENEALSNHHEIINLQTNYRSDHKLMKCLNDITTNFSKQFLPMIPKESSEAEFKTQAYFITTNDEYTGLAQHIINLNQQGVQFGEICVLFSQNKDISNFAKFAIKFNIPVQSQIASGFEKKREIIDLVSFLKFLVNPHDNLNLHILIRSPWFKMTDSEIFNIRQQNIKLSFWTQLQMQSQTSSPKNETHPDVINLLKYILLYKQNGILDALEKFILDSEFLKNSLLLDPTGKREANIYKFIANLKENLRSDQFILNNYLSAQFSSLQDDLSSNLNESIALFNGQRVSIMSIHAAKGLQFKHVLLAHVSSPVKYTKVLDFISNTISGQYDLPILNEDLKLTWSGWGQKQKNILNQKENLEFERLFYVAVTRAEKSISFIAETDKAPAKTSWYSKMNWPTNSQHNQLNQLDQQLEYSTESYYYSDEIVPLAINEKDKLTLKSKIMIDDSISNRDQEIGKLSITELISQDAVKKNTKINQPIIENHNSEIIDHLTKAQKGTDLHRLFESIKFLPKDHVFTKATADEKKALLWLFGLQEIPFEEILNSGYAEWGFGLRTQNILLNSQSGILQGQIDLWAKVENKIYILDYKTGSSAYSEKAVQQLERYSECLKKMNFIDATDDIFLAVLYPFEQRIIIKHKKFDEINPL